MSDRGYLLIQALLLGICSESDPIFPNQYLVRVKRKAALVGPYTSKRIHATHDS